jgi:hypothetical protein
MTSGPMLTDTAWVPRARRAALVAIAVSLGWLGLGLILALSWRDTLPVLVASHWGPGATGPNGFARLGAYLAVPTALGAVISLGLAAIARYWGRSAGTRRIGAGAAVWLAGFLACLTTGTLAIQRHLDDLTRLTIPAWVVLIALAAPTAVALSVARALPGDPPQPTSQAVPVEAPRWELGPDERAVWIEHTRLGRGVIVSLVVVVAVVTVAVALTQLWLMLAVPAVVGLLIGATTQFVVRVDPAGVSLRSQLGWPRTFIPVNEVEYADVLMVNPLADFGGWGWRVGRGGRVGVVLQRGPALQVVQTGGRALVVTVPNPEVGAGLLNTYAARGR